MQIKTNNYFTDCKCKIILKLAIISIFLISLFCGNVNVRAEESTDVILENEAIEFAQEFSGISEITVNEIKQLTEDIYVVTFLYQNIDYGFVVYEIIDQEYKPVEFLIEKDIDYESYTIDNSSQSQYIHAGSCMSSNVKAGLSRGEYKVLTSFSCISQSKIIQETGKYACSVVALTEIAQQNRILKNSSIGDTFNQLWTDTGTWVDKKESGVSYGLTYDSKLVTGMEKYVKRLGYKISITTESNPKYSFFRNAIAAGYSCTLSYRIDTISGERIGHTVNVIGYYSYFTSTLRPYFYIKVADGWTTTPKYILINGVDFVNSYGVSYNIYK